MPVASKQASSHSRILLAGCPDPVLKNRTQGRWANTLASSHQRVFQNPTRTRYRTGRSLISDASGGFSARTRATCLLRPLGSETPSQAPATRARHGGPEPCRSRGLAITLRGDGRCGGPDGASPSSTKPVIANAARSVNVSEARLGTAIGGPQTTRPTCGNGRLTAHCIHFPSKRRCRAGAMALSQGTRSGVRSVVPSIRSEPAAVARSCDDESR